MNREYTFTFGKTLSAVHIQEELPRIEDLRGVGKIILVCDSHTAGIARRIQGNQEPPLCILPPGENAKNWASVETILKAAKDAGLGRDGLFVGVGGGVISDMTAFAASIYMRGAGLCIVSTTLLGMVDAALGGKTGFDLFGMKNFVGTFYPASQIYMPLNTLLTLPEYEWKSGMAEIIKTAVLDKQGTFLNLLRSPRLLGEHTLEAAAEWVSRSVLIKGRVVEADPQETGQERALLNLGHTFAHALESSAGLGRISHGEAVAWGMVRSCELGIALGITPPARGEEIISLLQDFGYEITAPHPLMGDQEAFIQAIQGDKKKKRGKLFFVVPAQTGASLVSGDQAPLPLLSRILGGDYA